MRTYLSLLLMAFCLSFEAQPAGSRAVAKRVAFGDALPDTGGATAETSVAPSEQPRAASGHISLELRKKTFDVVWKTVKEKHFDPTFGGVDWDKVRNDYQGPILSAPDDQGFYCLLNEMLARLRVSHMRVFTRQEVDEPESMAASGGIDLRIVDGAALITRVAADSPASRAGLRPGFVIESVDGVSFAETIQKAGPEESETKAKMKLTEALLRRVRGLPGMALRVKYLDATDKEHEVVLTRLGSMRHHTGDDLDYYVDLETSRLASGMGYLRFNEFNPRLAKRIVMAVQSMKDGPGLIIDLRGNHGGDDSVGWKLAENLLSEPTLLYLSRTRKGVEEQRVKPAANPFRGPVVILVDALSVSAAEQFAAPMQELGRATVIGERTPGIDLDANIKKLPTGAFLLYAEGEPRTPKGVVIEGRGVIPDIIVPLTRDVLLTGRDPQIEAAVEHINNQGR